MESKEDHSRINRTGIRIPIPITSLKILIIFVILANLYSYNSSSFAQQQEPPGTYDINKCQGLTGDQYQKCFEYQQYNIQNQGIKAEQAQQFIPSVDNRPQVCLHYNPDGSCQSAMVAEDYTKALQEQQSEVTNSTFIGIIIVGIIIGILIAAIRKRLKRKQSQQSDANEERRKTILHIISELKEAKVGDLERIEKVRTALTQREIVSPSEIQYIKNKYNELVEKREQKKTQDTENC